MFAASSRYFCDSSPERNTHPESSPSEVSSRRMYPTLRPSTVMRSLATQPPWPRMRSLICSFESLKFLFAIPIGLYRATNKTVRFVALGGVFGAVAQVEGDE